MSTPAACRVAVAIGVVICASLCTARRRWPEHLIMVERRTKDGKMK